MVRQTKEAAVDRKRLLYDKDVLADVRDEYQKATEIKHHIDTTAFTYEIRTALRYWFGGKCDHRASNGIWNRCEAVDNGQWEWHDQTDTLIHAETGEPVQ